MPLRKLESDACTDAIRGGFHHMNIIAVSANLFEEGPQCLDFSKKTATKINNILKRV